MRCVTAGALSKLRALLALSTPMPGPLMLHTTHNLMLVAATLLDSTAHPMCEGSL